MYFCNQFDTENLKKSLKAGVTFWKKIYITSPAESIHILKDEIIPNYSNNIFVAILL